MTPLDVYREQVREAMLRRTGEPILNGNVDHAAIIAQETFGSAQKRIRILTHKLDPDCYARESVRNAARFFLADPDHRAEIIIEAALWDSNEKFEWHKHPFIRDLREFMIASADLPARLEVRLVSKAWADRYKFNFLLLDDYGFRYEADRTRAAAVVAFFPETGPKSEIENLNRIFTDLWNQSTPLEISKAKH